VRTRLRALLPIIVWTGLMLALGAGTIAWLGRNPFPDGYQNEYIHVGNAFDLFDALIRWDTWHLRYYVAHAYWPPLFYGATWPLQALWERSRDAMVLTNLAWLALALACTYQLARGRRAGIAAMLLLACSPGLFGTLVRYEPNIAQLGCLGLSLLALDRSQGLRHLRWSALAGLGLAGGLLTDRLGIAPFLALPMLLVMLPAAAPSPPTERVRIPRGATAALPSAPRWRLPWKGLLALALVVLVLAGPWYLQWFQNQLQEVSSQLTAGEIDAAGDLTEQPAQLGPRWLYYPLVLLDSQAGPVLGAWMLLGLGAALLRAWRKGTSLLRRPDVDGLLVACILAGWLLFTAVQKKQVFYTLPLILPFSVLGGRLLARCGVLRAPMLLLLLAAGLHQYGWRLWDRGSDTLASLGQPDPIPLSWVYPRHTMARAPSEVDLPMAELLEGIDGCEHKLVVFSDHHAYYEGFLSLTLRQAYADCEIHGLRGDPNGTYEWFRTAEAFLVIREGRAGRWPDRASMEAALESDHYSLEDLPPVIEMIVHHQEAWIEAGRWRLDQGATATLWKREG
jgi:hypothetical protein